jgi:hypothetical protein
METETLKTLSVVIAGWHFKNPDLYRKLVEEASYYKSMKTRFYIASHKDRNEIEHELISSVEDLGWNILTFENKGWDWGAYQQLLIWQKNHEELSDYYLFLHDDVMIKKKGFLEAFIAESGDEAKVVGNSLPYRGPLEIKWTETSPHIFFWAKSKGLSLNTDEEWKCIRGSCFFTVKEIAENILMNMPVKHGLHCGFGNWSVKIFGGLVRELYGREAIRYLSQKVRKSRYIDEDYRGRSREAIVRRSIHRVKSKMPLSVRKVVKRIKKGQKSPPSPEGLKLNLGCGDRYREGHLNIDACSQIADINGDILDLEFDDESVSEISMVHVIEHIDFSQVRPLLKRFFSWLRKEGLLIIEFPDVLKVARCVLQLKGDLEKLEHSPFGIRGFYGEPFPDMSIHDYHKWGWSERSLKSLLEDVGFSKTFTERPQFHGQQAKRDTRIVAIKKG